MKGEPTNDCVLLLSVPSASHCLLCAVFSWKGSHCAPRYNQISLQVVFYKSPIAFSRLPVAEIVRGFYHVRSETDMKQKRLLIGGEIKLIRVHGKV